MLLTRRTPTGGRWVGTSRKCQQLKPQEAADKMEETEFFLDANYIKTECPWFPKRHGKLLVVPLVSFLASFWRRREKHLWEKTGMLSVQVSMKKITFTFSSLSQLSFHYWWKSIVFIHILQYLQKHNAPDFTLLALTYWNKQSWKNPQIMYIPPE